MMFLKYIHTETTGTKSKTAESRKPVRTVGETKDRLVRKYMTLEAAIFLRVDKLCEINGNGDNKVKADIHTQEKVWVQIQEEHLWNE